MDTSALALTGPESEAAAGGFSKGSGRVNSKGIPDIELTEADATRVDCSQRMRSTFLVELDEFPRITNVSMHWRLIS